MNKTIESLVDALKSNRDLQAAVSLKLQRLAEKKAENRRKAAQTYHHIGKLWRDHNSSSPKELSDENVESLAQMAGKDPSNSYLSTKVLKRKLKDKWGHNPNRRWTRRFFVDPDGNIPEPNEDTVKRRKLEEGKSFHHRCPKWTTKETSNLRKIVTAMEKESEGDDPIDFEKVAVVLKQRSRTASNPEPPNRTGEECRLWFEGNKKASPLSKGESLKIMENVHLHGGNPPWDELQLEGRTAWQCFVAYQSRLSDSKKTAWTPEQDELLLKYLAAMGPQFVVDMEAAAEISRAILPDKTPKVVLTRINASQLNPNVSRTNWSDEEDRKVVLAMKVYRDEPSPLVCTAVSAAHNNDTLLPPSLIHFLFVLLLQIHFPDRMSKSVTEKWNRCLNPAYNSLKAFTDKEDKIILAGAAEKKGWAEIARQLPGRHPRTIQQRWTEIAGSEQLVQKYEQGVKKKSMRRGGPLLDADDFIVRVKQK